MQEIDLFYDYFDYFKGFFACFWVKIADFVTFSILRYFIK